MDRRRCRAWESVIVGCFTYLKGLETASLVPGKISLTKLFASFARDRSMYFVVLVKENKKDLIPSVESLPAPPHTDGTESFLLWSSRFVANTPGEVASLA